MDKKHSKSDTKSDPKFIQYGCQLLWIDNIFLLFFILQQSV